MKRWCAGLLVLATLGIAGAAGAESSKNPVGRWKTIDDSTGKPKSIVLVWEKNGTVYGTIETVFPDPGQPADPICDKCEGYLKNKPIKGMLFMWGLTRDDDEWSGGRILDPENGKTYKCYIEVVDGGKRLKVRGYIGLSLIGRTQYWEKAQ